MLTLKYQIARVVGRVDMANGSDRSNAIGIVCYLCLVTFVFQSLLYAFNSSLFFNAIGLLDPFLYVGYGLYYAIPDYLNGYYKVSRLPWDLVQFAARQTLRPEAAAFAIQFVSFSAMSMAAYFFFRHTAGRTAALLLAIFFIFFTIAYNNGGADYHNTITGALYFLMLALLANSIVKESLPVAGFAGGAVALALHTNPTLVLLAPGIALHCLACCWKRQRSLRFILLALGLLVVGCVAATVALGLVSWAFGRGFLFFRAQLDYMLWIKGNNPWWHRLTWEAFKYSKPNIYAFGISLLCAIELCNLGLSRRIRDNLEAAAAYLGYIVTYLVAVICELSGQTVLEPDYMVYAIVLPTFVPLGYLIEYYLRPLSRPAPFRILMWFPLICGGTVFASSWIYNILHLYSIYPLLLVFLVLGIFYFALVTTIAARSSIVVFLLLATLDLALIPYAGAFGRDTCHVSRDFNVFMNDASLLATKITGHPQRVWITMDPDEVMLKPCLESRRVRDLGASFVELGHRFLGKPFGAQRLAELTKDDFAPVIKENGVVALFAVEMAVETQLLEQARTLGIELKLEALLPEPTSGVELYLLRAQAR
jgi:hypothetical protein